VRTLKKQKGVIEMTSYEALPEVFQPAEITWEFPGDETLITNAGQELRQRAAADPNGCFGYFPGMQHRSGIDSDLPESQSFADTVPSIDLSGRVVGFNFLRLSVVRQNAISPYHLDSDAATAITGDTSTIQQRQVWRFLMNLADEHPRTLSYLDVDPATIEITDRNGYVHPADPAVAASTERSLTIPPREGRIIRGVLFCASQVLHAGQDDDWGHFVAGYGHDGPFTR
jgi:hypothetical protein